MKKSKSGMIFLFLSTLICSSDAFSQIPQSKVEKQVQSAFIPYRQTGISPSVQELIQSKIEQSTYSVKYSRSSELKNVELNNALLKVKVYYNGNPKGIMIIATDDQQ